MTNNIYNVCVNISESSDNILFVGQTVILAKTFVGYGVGGGRRDVM